MNNEQIRAAEDIFYLCGCLLNGCEFNHERVSKADLELIYRVSKQHTIGAIVCMALEASGAFKSAAPEVVKKFKEMKNLAVKKNMLLDAERKKLFEFMDENKIWHMPLKGIILKDIYPKYGMRQMADNDILFDPAFQLDIKNYMVSRGYKAEAVGKGNHDVYKKMPVYNFELHTALFGAAHNEVWVDYYKNVKERLISKDGYCCNFTDEDFYVYITVHAYKHFSHGGTGLRALIDNYVFVSKKGGGLDWDYISAELIKLGIVDFERECRGLAKAVFCHDTELSDEEIDMLGYYLGSGTYGTIQNSTRNRLASMQSDKEKISGSTKLKYLFSRLFPDMNFVKQNYPFIYRHKLLLPFFYLFRLFKGLIFRGKHILSEIKTVGKTT